MYNEITLDAVESALEYIDPNLPYADWSKIGRALYSEFGDSVREIFEAWSAQGASYNSKSFKSWWKNFRGTKKTTIGSFIYEATQAGWQPERIELTAEEKAAFAKKREQRQLEAQAKRDRIEREQWNALKLEEQQFNSWPSSFAPTGYMKEKHMVNLQQYADVRLGTDKYKRPFLAWPIYEELYNKGRFCGYEKIIDKRVRIGDKQLNKFSSENANTSIGFITFGKECDHSQCDRGRIRVFVVGGLADAYSAHVCTGETVITPIGEGNIPNLIHRLEKKHPEIQFIAAPDNDKTGWTMIERSKAQWTLPQTQGYDWSDVYINEGNEALIKQLLYIRGFKTIESNSRYLSADIKPGLNLLKSGMGTGKSTLFKKFIKENSGLKTLIVSHRRALARSLREGINDENIQVEYYEDLIITNPGQGIDANMALREAGILVCSVDSLHRLANSQWDAIFIDEVEQNLGHYFAETNQHGEACLNFLTFALTHTRYQILADAHLGDLTLAFCNRIGLHSGIIYKNNYKTGMDANGQPKKLFVYNSRTQLTEVAAQQLMSKGKRYVYANSKREVKRLATILEQERERGNYDGKTLVVHADVTNDEEVATALQDINAVAPGLDAIIASPTLGTGFDISSSAHNFDKTIGFLSSHVGTSEEGHQGLNRARDINEFHVFIDNTTRSEPVDANYIHSKLIDEVSTETMKLLSIDPETGTLTSRNPLYEWLYCEVKALHNKSKNDYKTRFISLADQDGYEIIFVADNPIQAEFGKAIREQANERNNRETLREVSEASVHTGEAFSDMLTNGEFHSAAEIAKSKVVHDLNLDNATEEELDSLVPMTKELYNDFLLPGENAKFNDADAPIEMPTDIQEAVTNALTYKQLHNRYVNAIKRLSWVNVNPHTANILDTKDVQHAPSRVSWRHLSIKRGHMIKILQMAGIDESLNYNGHTWTADDLNKVLSPWLSKAKNKDRLFKYSNITVTSNALKNPCQWLNTHLRSLGIPVVSNKKRVKGKPINVYSVDVDALAGVRSLVDMRTRGIESSVDESMIIDVKLLNKSVTNFIKEINKGVIKSGFKDRYYRLDQQCEKSGQKDLRNTLAQAFIQIIEQFDITEDELPLPGVIYKALNKNVTNFIQEINKGVIKSEFKDHYYTLNLQCEKLGQEDLRDALSQAFAQIVDQYDILESDPPLPSVIYKSVGKGGSPSSDPSLEKTPANNTDYSVPTVGLESLYRGGEEESPILFSTAHDFSIEIVKQAYSVARFAVDVYKLSVDKVREFMDKEGLDVFTGDVKAWAGTLREVLV